MSRDSAGIVVSDLWFAYGGRPELSELRSRSGEAVGAPGPSSSAKGARYTLSGVNASIPSGAVAAVVGPNGSGKSTLLKVISGYLRPSAGSVLLNGRDPFSLSHAARSRIVTYCGDEPEPAFDFTVAETVEMGRQAGGGRPAATFEAPDCGKDALAGQIRSAMNITPTEEAMRQVGVFDLRGRTITSLSSGERQRVYIARAICQDPDIFLLDEPTAHLDMAYELQVMDLVVRLARERGKTVLVVVHDLNLALRYAALLLFVKDGAIICGIEPAAVTPDIVRRVYGVEVAMSTNPVLGCQVVMPVAPERLPTLYPAGQSGLSNAR